MLYYYFDHTGRSYGPFPALEDGSPDPRAVLRKYRKLKNMRGNELAAQLGVSKQMISQMENLPMKMPQDISRRKALAQVVGIPSVLMGLADPLVRSVKPYLETHLDISLQEVTLPLLWTTFQSGANLTVLEPGVLKILGTLSGANDVASLQLKAKALRLYSLLLRDQRLIPEAISVINQAITIGHELKSNDLLASGYLSRGRIEVEADRHADAIPYFEQALLNEAIAKTSIRGTTLIELAMARAHLVRSQHDRSQVKWLVEQAADIAMSRPPEDGSYTMISPGLCYGYQGLTAMTMGDYTQAGTILSQAENLLVSTQERRRAKVQTLFAQQKIFSGQDLDGGIALLCRAHKTSTELDSKFNLHTIKLLNQQVLAGKWANTPQVRQLQTIIA